MYTHITHTHVHAIVSKCYLAMFSREDVSIFNVGKIEELVNIQTDLLNLG